MNKKDILNCKSKSDVCQLLNISNNGRGMKKVDNLLSEYNISLDYFNNEKKYYKNPKYCKYCNNILSYDKRNNNFCNSSCSASFNNKDRKLSENTKNKIKDSIIKYRYNNPDKLIGKPYQKITETIDIKCNYCNNLFTVRNIKKERRKKYCSDKCRKEGTKINLSKAMKERVKKGLHKGWQSRNILSYPEKFFIDVLKNNNLFDKCKTNYPIMKKDLGLNENGNYFLDFYFKDKNIDLEIDGKQHNRKDRKISDEKRDKYLFENNINVYRIKWKSINNKKGKKYIKNEINKFLEYYKNTGQ